MTRVAPIITPHSLTRVCPCATFATRSPVAARVQAQVRSHAILRPLAVLGALGALQLTVAVPAGGQRFLDTLPASAYARAERFMSHRAADKMYRNRVDVRPMPLGAIRGWSFIGPSSEQQALAELGFIVLPIQARGVRDPSPAIRNYYRTQYQGRYAEATLADNVEAIKQLGARFSWIDLDKVGLYGTSGGGLSTTVGMFRYPDFFKVGVAFAGNHDDRSEHTIVGESWRGMLRKDSTGRDNYEGDANYLLVNNLRGKLMLVHGDLDEAVHPSMTIRVAAALIDAGKRFDMMVFPDQGHSSGGWYGSRLIFDYFVRNLTGYEVPEYTFTGVADPLASMRRRAKPAP